MNLNTIKDFDFGVGPTKNGVVRVSEVPPDVTKSEVNLVLWLMLEHQLLQVDVASMKQYRDDYYEDSVDSVGSVAGSPPVDDLSVGLTDKQRRRTASRSARARKHAVELLRKAGVSLPFHQLSIADRKNLFQQFASTTELLRDRNVSSISELFEVLRTESKLRKQFEVGERLGGGHYGNVYSVLHRETKVRYAAKRISLTLDSFEEMKMTLNESKILRSLEHDNIVQCADAWLEMQYDPKCAESEENEQEPLKFYVLMDICYQSLRQWMEDQRQKPTMDEIVLILKHTISALKFLHSRPILHLDINPQNIMWADKEKTCVKVGDFGLAIKGDSYPYKSGTFPYAANDGIFTNKSDIYSLGVTILEVAEHIITTQELCKRLKDRDLTTEFLFLNNTLPIILTETPNTRPTAEQLQQMLERILNPPLRPIFMEMSSQ